MRHLAWTLNLLLAQLLTPVGGEVWRAGEVRSLQWTPQAGAVTVEFTPTGNFQFVPVTTQASDTGSFEWTVPNLMTKNGRIRVTHATSGDEWFSPQTFTVLHIPTAQSAGELYLSASPTARVGQIVAERLEPFSLYLVTDIDFSGLPFTSSLKAWEASLTIPAELTVTKRELLMARAIDLGNGEDNFVVGIGSCPDAASMPLALLRLDCLLLASVSQLAVGIGPSQPSSIDPADAPAWAGCDYGDVWPYPMTWGLTIHPAGTAVVPRSWGEVKSGFRP